MLDHFVEVGNMVMADFVADCVEKRANSLRNFAIDFEIAYSKKPHKTKKKPPIGLISGF